MSNRGLLAATLTALASENDSKFHSLVKIGLASPLAYTTAPYSIDYDGHTFLSNGTLVKVPPIKESVKIKPSFINIIFSGVELIAQALTMNVYKNSAVSVYRHYPATGQTIEVFSGVLDSFTSTNDRITWRVGNHWTRFDEQRGRILSDDFQQRLFAGDRGFEYVSKTAPALDYWGKYRIGTTYSQEQQRFVTGSYIPTHSPSSNSRDISRSIIEGEQGFSFGDLYEEVKKTGSANYLPLYYGDAVVKGIPVFRFVSGIDSEYLHVVYAVCEGAIQAFDDITFDYGSDEPVSYTDARFIGYVDEYLHGGTDAQTVDTILKTATDVYGSSEWTNDHRLRGVAYVHMRYKYSEEIWEGEPDPSFVIRARKPDTSSTSGFYSQNPAWVLYDYLKNTTFGKGIPTVELNAASFVTAAAYCDTVIQEYSGGGNVEKFKFSGGVSTAKTLQKNIEIILGSARMFLVRVGNEFKVVQETKSDESVYSFTADNYDSESLEVTEGGLKDLANLVYFKFTDGLNNDEEDIVIAESAAYLAIDGQELRVDTGSKYEKNRYRAIDKANVILKRSREQLSAEFGATLADAIKVEPANIIDITNETRGWVNKKFRVHDMILDDDGSVEFDGLVEYESTVFDRDVPAEYIAPNTVNTIDHFTVASPLNFNVTAGSGQLLFNKDGTVITRALVEFDKPNSVFIAGYELEYKLSTDAVYNKIHMGGIDNTDVFISMLQDGKLYNFRVRAYNGLGRYSIWISRNETVTGKLSSPTSPSNLAEDSTDNIVNLTWDDPTDTDFSYTEVWASDDNNRTNAVLIGSPLKPAFNHAVNKVQYYWLKSYDTSGNISSWYPISDTGGFAGAPNVITSGDPIGGSGVNIMNPRYSDFEEYGATAPDYTTVNCVETITAEGDGHGGFGRALRLISTGSGIYCYLGTASNDYNFNITPNNVWIVSVYAKQRLGTATNFTVSIRTPTTIYTSGTKTTSGSGWNRYDFVIDLSADSSETALAYFFASISSGDIDFDQLMIEEQVGSLTTPSAYHVPTAAIGVVAEWGATNNIITRWTTPHLNPTIGDLWFDTGFTLGIPNALLYWYTGSAWQVIGNDYGDSEQLTDGDLWAEKAKWETVTGVRLPRHIDNNAISYDTMYFDLDAWSLTGSGASLITNGGGMKFEATTSQSSLCWRYLANTIKGFTFAKDSALRFSGSISNASYFSTANYSHVAIGNGSHGYGVWLRESGGSVQIGLYAEKDGTPKRSTSLTTLSSGDKFECLIEHEFGVATTLTMVKNDILVSGSKIESVAPPVAAITASMMLPHLETYQSDTSVCSINLQELFYTQEV